MNMKSTFLTCAGVLAFALTAASQTPFPSPDSAGLAVSPSPSLAPESTPPVTTAATPMATASAVPASTVAPALAPSASPDTEEDFDRAIEQKINKQFDRIFDGDKSHHSSEDDPWWIAVIVLIGCLFFFGTPVAIVAAIMYFSFSKSRALHKTVRMMVEKGQPVPEALLNPPPVVRQRSDLRRGITLLMVGAGLMVFLGAVNDWDGGAWSVGIIPFLIGLGYLLVWKLDVRGDDASPKV